VKAFYINTSEDTSIKQLRDLDVHLSKLEYMGTAILFSWEKCKSKRLGGHKTGRRNASALGTSCCTITMFWELDPELI
jgi:hypothetical protein